MSGTKQFELMESSKPEDQKAAKRLRDYCFKAEAAFYEYSAVQALRKQFWDVL